MPTIEDNQKAWDGKYDWKGRGDEWSRSWGGVDMQWFGSLLPRIHSFVPSGNIAEIACGYGRWTGFLKEHCQSLIATDLSEQCVSASRERFVDDPRVSCHVTDGKSLPMIADRWADFVFSFDSLVHVDDQVMRGYIDELARILASDGVAFLHHSNLAESLRQDSRVFRRCRSLLQRAGIVKPEDVFWRDGRVDATLVAEHAAAQGLRCISQELFPWATNKRFMDCISIIVRQGSRRDREPRVLRNSRFMNEGHTWKGLSPLYSEA